jgi:hypothetical protein
MNGQAGKGDKIRKGADLKAYWDNYDNIFKKVKSSDQVQQTEDKKQSTDETNNN